MAKSKTLAREALLRIVADSKGIPVSEAITALLDGKGLTGKHARANGSHLVTRLVRDGLVSRKDGVLKATAAGKRAVED